MLGPVSADFVLSSVSIGSLLTQQRIAFGLYFSSAHISSATYLRSREVFVEHGIDPICQQSVPFPRAGINLEEHFHAGLFHSFALFTG